MINFKRKMNMKNKIKDDILFNNYKMKKIKADDNVIKSIIFKINNLKIKLQNS